ncbi:MAG: DNA repair protein RadC [Wujia sp.]
MHNLIKNLAACERPYEKALRYGVETLSDAELLSLVLRTGTKDTGVLGIANQILNIHPTQKGLIGLNYLLVSDLKEIPGVGDVKAIQILAVAELAYRMNLEKAQTLLEFQNPQTIADYYIQKCKYFTTEHAFVLLLTNAHTLIKEIELSNGTVNQTQLSPREVFLEAVRYGAVHIILVHNHPSGYPEPSQADVVITRQIQEAGKIMNIQLSDHIIVAQNSYISMLERGLL